MTSTQSMQRRGRERRSDGTTKRRTAFMRLLCSFMLVIIAAGCAPRLEQPMIAAAPYERSQLWAVAPFANESGVTVVDEYRTADLFAQEVQAVRGINVIPVNRVIRAMRELEIDSIATPGDARLIMTVLGVDGLIVGTISAYDPYPPLTLGMAVELHVQPRRDAKDRIDPRELIRSPSGNPAAGHMGPSNPVAQTAGIFDATSHLTLAQLRAYARGRSVPESAYGQDIYLVSMDRYTQFVSHRLILSLLASERQRVNPVDTEVASR